MTDLDLKTPSASKRDEAQPPGSVPSSTIESFPEATFFPTLSFSIDLPLWTLSANRELERASRSSQAMVFSMTAGHLTVFILLAPTILRALLAAALPIRAVSRDVLLWPMPISQPISDSPPPP